VRAIALDCHNGKVGAAAQGRMIPLSRAYQGSLWEALCESLDTFSRDHIQDAVDEALATDEPPCRRHASLCAAARAAFSQT